VVCTPHIGASTDQASQAIADETVRIVTWFMKTGQALNAVNVRPPAVDKTHLLVRHYNRVGVIAKILTPLRDQGINIEDMQDLVFQTGTAACCTLALDSAPSVGTLEKIRSAEDVIAVEL
jgi:D-3-phosphoglycerate dehydrogenase